MTDQKILDSYKKKAEAKCIPLQASLELTSKCNHTCLHCYVDKNAESDLSFEQWKVILDKLRKAGTLYVIFLGGEALIHPAFFKIVEYAHQLDFHTSLITNAFLIENQEYANKLEKIGLNNITISLYSTKEKIHDEMTGMPGSYQRIIKAIEYLKNTKINIGINTLLTKKNIEDYFLVCEFAINHKLDFNSDPVVTCDLMGKQCNLSLRPSKDQLAQHFKDKGKKWPESIPKPNSVDLDATICNMARTKCAVNHRGELLPCVEIRAIIGNLLEDDFQTIWTSDQADKWRLLKNKNIKNLFNDSTDGFLDVCPGMGLNEMCDALIIPEYMKMLAQVQKKFREDCMQSYSLPFTGKSMLPLLRDQDEVIVNFSKTDVEVGDIVIIRLDKELVVHRLIQTGPRNILKGDRSLHFDEISLKDVLGKVEGFIRNQKVYRWGPSGHLLKKYVAYCSHKTQRGFPIVIRRFFYLIIFLLIQIASLFFVSDSPLTNKNHI